MLNVLLAAGLAMISIDYGMPEPYVGIGLQSFPEPTFLGFDSATGDEITRTSRRKYFQIGVPFSVAKFNHGEMKNFRLLVVPEIAFNHNMIQTNVGLGVEQFLPFTGYRSVPAGIFWSFSSGLHYGFILDAKDYSIVQDLNETTQSYSLKSLNLMDRTSIAAHFRFAFGPEFSMSSWMDIRVRFFFDLMVGKIGPYQSRTTFSDNIGSLMGFQLQIPFK